MDGGGGVGHGADDGGGGCGFCGAIGGSVAVGLFVVVIVVQYCFDLGDCDAGEDADEEFPTQGLGDGGWGETGV